MRLRLWLAGVGTGLLLLAGGLLAGPISSFAASSTPTSQSSATPQSGGSAGTSSTPTTNGHNCDHANSGG
ncbi:MAG: hypothetical protein WBW04_03070 [Nitrolancea sp.]